MSKTIDQKVVEMRFDNAQFEKGVAQTLASTEKLKSGLDFDGVNASVSSQLSGIGTSLENLEYRFSAFGSFIFGIKAKIINAFAEMAKGLTNFAITGPIKAGFEKYEKMMDSIQIVMSATRDQWEDQGEQMEYVTEQIEKLNWYTDETSYSLTDMTNNIGKFTSAGIDLEDAVVAMQGIGSWAGQSGASVEQMNRAMYNLSQAMALGSVRVQDWMSIENANMATLEFKQTAIQTAIELGTLKEKADGTVVAIDQYGKEVEVTAETFRSTLATGWFSKEVLTETLGVYGNFVEELHQAVDETGLTTTELLGHIDDYKEALENGEDMTKWVQDLAKSENITNVNALGGALESLSSDYYELGRSAFKASQECRRFSQVTDALKDAMSTAWMGIFTAIFGDYLESKELWSSIAEELYEVFVDPLNNIRRIFESWGDLGGREALLDALWGMWDAIKPVITIIQDGLKDLFPDQFDILKFTYQLRDFAENMQMIDFPWYSEIQNIKDGVQSLVNTIKNLGKFLSQIGETISGAWEKIFPKRGDKDFFSITEVFRDVSAWLEKMSEKLIMSEEQMGKLERAFSGVFAVLDILKEFIFAVAEAFGMITEESEGFGDGILDGAAAIGDFLVQVRDWIKENDVWRKGIKAVIDWIKDIPNKLNAVSMALFNMPLGDLWNKIKDGASKAWETIKDFFINLPIYADQACQAIFNMSLEDVWTNIKQAASDAWETLKEIVGKIVALFKKPEESTGGAGEGIVETLPSGEDAEPVETFADKIANSFQKIKDGWEVVKPYFEEIGNMIKNTNFEFPSLENLGEAGKTGGVIAILGGIAAVIWKFVAAFTKLDKEKTAIVNSVKYMFTSIGDAAKALKQNIQAQTFKTIATAILEIAAAIFILAILPQDKMVGAGLAIAGLFYELAYVFETVTNIKASEKKMAEIRKVIDALSVILAVIIAGIFVIATQTDITAAITAAFMIGILLLEVAGILEIFDSIRGNEKKAQQVVAMIDAVAIVIASMGAAIMMATMFGSWEQIAAAGAVMAIMLAEIELFLLNLDKVKTSAINIPAILAVMTGIGEVLLAMGTALLIATAGNADWTQLAAAGVAMSLMMLSIAGAMKIMPEEKIMRKTASVLVIASGAFKKMGDALAVVANSGADWQTIAVSGLVLAGMLEAIALAFRIMPESESILKSAAAIAVASFGILMMAEALAILGQLNLQQIGVALLGLLGALILVLVAGAAANYVGAGLLILGGALALIGAGAMMAGAGLWLVAQAMQTLFSLDANGVNTMILAIQAFFGILPSLLEQVARGILAFMQVFVNAREAIKEMFVGTFTTIIEAYMEVMPQFINAVVETIMQILEAYRTIMPEVVLAVTETLVAILEALTTLLPALFDFLYELFMSIDTFVRETAPTFVATVMFVLNLLFIALDTFTRANLPKLVDLITFVVGELCRSIAETTSVITATIIGMLIDLLNQVLANIGEVISLSVQIGIEIICGFMDGIAESIPDVIDSAMNLLLAFINGISDAIDKYAPQLKEALDKLVTSIKNGICTLLGIPTGGGNSSIFNGFGGNIIDGLIAGVKAGMDAVKNAVEGVANAAVNTFKSVLGIASPSKVFKKMGNFMDEGLVIGLNEYSDKVADASENVGNTAISSMSSAIANISSTLEDSMDANPTIRPVLDLTDITAGVDTMNSMFNNDYALGLSDNADNYIASQIAKKEAMLNMVAEMKNRSDNALINPAMNQQNTFNITGDDPKTIAEEVSKVLQNQVDRRNAVWA